MKRVVSSILLAILLTSMLCSAFKIMPAEAAGIIHIRADGSIDPPTAPIQRNGDVYALTGDINSGADGIVVERSSIIVDGNGYTLQGTGVDSKGIGISNENNVTIKNMNINLFEIGVVVEQGSHLNVFQNNITNNYRGILLDMSSHNSISKNNVVDNTYGIYLGGSSSNTVSGNKVTSNTPFAFGIVLGGSSNNVLRNNTMMVTSGWAFNFWVSGENLSDFMNDVDSSNTVQGKPVYYWINQSDRAVPLDAGYVAIVSSTRVTAQNLELTLNAVGILLVNATNSIITRNSIENNLYGISLYFSSNNTISGNDMIANNNVGILVASSSDNNISGNNITTGNGGGIHLGGSNNNSISENNIVEYWEGIELTGCSDNSVEGNNIKDNHSGIMLDGGGKNSSNNNISENNIENNVYGIYLQDCVDNNRFYHNNFIANSYQVNIIVPEMNIWDDGYPSGGNYWSDYAGVDADGDGIGDTPYVIDANNQDRYPLMHPWSPPSVHNINTGLDYATIQKAINAPQTLDGHTIFVEAGTYYENVVVNKTVSLIGENSETAVIDGRGMGAVINVMANSVAIEEFTLRNGDGIYVDNYNHTSIRDNIVTNNDYGMILICSSNNTISGNTITNNYDGIALFQSSNNSISGNNIYNNTDSGVYMEDFSSDNRIYENNIVANNLGGIFIYNSSRNIISRNNITMNGEAGIDIYLSSDNTVCENSIAGNDHEGIWIDESSNNRICGNNIKSNTDGIWLELSSDNTVCENSITANSYDGIWICFSSNNSIVGNNMANNRWGLDLDESSNNIIYHNSFVNNTNETYVYDSVNVWDDGYPSGGNYWSSYLGADLHGGIYQNETGSDMIGDSPYVIDENNTDHYPLMGPWTATGENVTVTHATGISLTFSNVTSSGVTTVNQTEIGPDPPVGFKLATDPPVYFDIKTTANYSGGIRLAVPYDDTGLMQVQESSLSLMHWSEAQQQWTDITTFVDTDNNIIYGETDSFSLFALTISIYGPGDINKDKIVDIFDITIVALAFSSTPAIQTGTPLPTLTVME
jgi:parallel beta-helix repeat protein